MALGARELGMEYLAVTDHSRRVAMAHGLDAARLRKQGREIERVEARVGIRLPDLVLSELDWVVAAVHYKMIKAIRNPNVDVIGHPKRTPDRAA
jgi:DNA polymerase (family 10)